MRKTHDKFINNVLHLLVTEAGATAAEATNVVRKC